MPILRSHVICFRRSLFQTTRAHLPCVDWQSYTNPATNITRVDSYDWSLLPPNHSVSLFAKELISTPFLSLNEFKALHAGETAALSPEDSKDPQNPEFVKSLSSEDSEDSEDPKNLESVKSTRSDPQLAQPGDLEFLPLSSLPFESFQDQNPTFRNCLILRKQTREAYDLAVDMIRKPGAEAQNIVIRGSAGIGKSVTALYAMKLLLDDKDPRLVIYVHCRDELVYAFERPKGSSNVKVYTFEVLNKDVLDNIRFAMSALKYPETVLLYDPPEKTGEAPWSVKASIISPCSPNEAHYVSYSQSELKIRFLQCAPFELGELEALFSLGMFRGVIPTLLELRNRFFLFGGSLRKCLWTPQEVQVGINSILQKFDEIPEHIYDQFFKYQNRTIKNEVAPAWVSNRLWSYFPSSPNDIRAGPASNFVKELATKKFYKLLRMRFEKADVESVAGSLFQSFAGFALSLGGCFEIRNLRNPLLKGHLRLPKTKLLGTSNFPSVWPALRPLAELEPEYLFQVESENVREPLVDYVLARDHAFQMTIGATHFTVDFIAVASAKRLIGELGFSATSKLHLILVVPSTQWYSSWWEKRQDLRDPKVSQKWSESAIEEARDHQTIDDCIEQWVLSISSSPASFDRVSTLADPVWKALPAKTA